jgi:tRNA-2-methylthio-N6-dimethylallyladenosine synthase
MGNEIVKQRRAYILTIGCQMNVYDSQMMFRRLAPMGYIPVPDETRADLIVVNTCTIRAKAEQKALSFLGRLPQMKQTHPGLIIAVGGCLAQQEGRRLLKRFPHVDIVFGSHTGHRLPEMIRDVETLQQRVVDVHFEDTIHEAPPGKGGPDHPGVASFVTIMRGCDNYCTYCVVPYVRGREISRKPDRIVDEVTALVAAGVKEITLLGQNVNSYGGDTGTTFTELLTRIDRIPGLQRIRFTTSHPKDLSDALIRSFAELEKLCPHIHLPVQSGSNAVLKRMNRKYTREHYLERIERLRQCRPDMAISSDFIAGFPGETDADFDQTLSLIQAVRYDSLFAFIYSDRPSAPATRFADKVPERQKAERLQRLLDLQADITHAKNRDLVGSTQEILVEGTSKRPVKNAAAAWRTQQWAGRTGGNRIVNFVTGGEAAIDGANLVGRCVAVRIEEALANSLRGRLVTVTPHRKGCKGESYHAA